MKNCSSNFNHWVAERLVCWPVSRWSRILAPASAKHMRWKLSFNCRKFSDLHEKLSCTITPGNMSLLNCEIYPRWWMSMVADTKLRLLIAHFIRQPSSTLGVGLVRCNPTNQRLLIILNLTAFWEEKCVCIKKNS